MRDVEDTVTQLMKTVLDVDDEQVQKLKQTERFDDLVESIKETIGEAKNSSFNLDPDDVGEEAKRKLREKLGQ